MHDRGEEVSRSLFGGAFAPYRAALWVKVVYALWLGVTTLLCVTAVLAGFGRSATVGVVSLAVVSPLFFLLSLVSARVFIKAILARFGIRRGLTPVPAEARVPSRAPLPR